MSSARNSYIRHVGVRGVTSLELALVLVIFMVLIMAIFDLGRYFFTTQAMVTLMTDSARYVMVQQNAGQFPPQTINQEPIAAWASSTGNPHIITIPTLLDSTRGTITISFLNLLPVPSVGVNQVQVEVDYPFNALTPGLSLLSGTLKATATYSY